jgi:hypothetical protein
MICELCNKENPTTCDQHKNGYCLLFNKQAEKDIRQFGPKSFKTLADLQPHDTFRYKGSDENDWHVVSRIDEKKLYYAGVNNEQSNHRVENVEVIVK